MLYSASKICGLFGYKNKTEKTDVLFLAAVLHDSFKYGTNPDEVRQLIFFPDGHLRYSWVYDGAIIL